MRKTLAAIVAIFGFVVAPLAAQQQHHRRWAADSTMFEQLGLTPDQRDKIHQIRDQVEQQNAPLREQMQQALGGKSFRDLTPEERESFRPKIEPIRKQMMENRRKAHEQINAILTSEQREKLDKQMKEHRRGRKEHEGEGSPS
jgi:Spy/CpxP family protein refolding chaperone